jgi:PAS domain S-box-containing protein
MQKWLNLSVKRKSLIVLFIPFLSILLSFSLFFLIGRQEEESQKWLFHTLEVKNHIHRSHNLLIETEAKLRGYFLIGQPLRLEVHRQSRSELHRSFDMLARLVKDNPTQITLVQQLRRDTQILETKWDDLLSNPSLLRSVAGSATGNGRQAVAQAFSQSALTLDEIRHVFKRLEANESQLLKARHAQADFHKQTLRASIGAGLLLGVLGSIVASLLFSQGVVRRIQHVEERARLLVGGSLLPPSLQIKDEIGRLDTELEVAARLLAEQERQFRSLFEAAGDGIVLHPFTTTPTEGHFVQANSVICQMLGYSLDEMRLLTPFDIQSKDDWDLVPDEAEQITTQGNLRFERRLLRKDGSQFSAELQATTLKLEERLMVLSVIRDVTQRQKAAIAIQTAKEEAERAREEAERANEAKSEFLSRMSHELRTPMNAILGFGQLLELDDLTPEQSEQVQHIMKGGRHLLELINEVLEIARIESGQLQLSLEPVQIQEVIGEVLALTRPLAAARGVQLRNEVIDQHLKCFIQADRQKLKQVLLNLIANAIKYNRENGSVILSCVHCASGDLRICVQDTGFGIPPEKQDRLFQPFERLGAENLEVEGTGLGLALSQRLVLAMAGRIGVESSLGHGSIFWIEFPQVQSLLLPTEISDGVSSNELLNRFNEKTVLYIEDNLSNLKLIEQIFSRRTSIKLLAAMQGRLGVELAREHQPDLILLDLHLPDIQGQEVLRLLQEGQRTRTIPVIVVSADATVGQIQRLMSQGAHGYLTKPFNVQELLQAVDSILSNQQSLTENIPS